MIQSIKLVVFDFDGTIANTGITVLKILNILRAELGKPILQFSEISPNISFGGKSLIERALGSEVNHQLYLEKFRTMYLLDNLENEDLYPGVKNLIQSLLNINIKIAICSNKPKKLLEKALIRHELVDCFNHIYADDGIMSKKPNPEVMNTIMRLANVVPKQVILVGDSTIDQDTAINAKVRFFFHKNGYDDGVKMDKVNYSFSNYRELEEMFK